MAARATSGRTVASRRGRFREGGMSPSRADCLSRSNGNSGTRERGQDRLVSQAGVETDERRHPTGHPVFAVVSSAAAEPDAEPGVEPEHQAGPVAEVALPGEVHRRGEERRLSTVKVEE